MDLDPVDLERWTELLDEEATGHLIEFLEQIAAAVEGDLGHLALMGTVVIPDLLAALASPDGRSNRDGYMAWYRANVGEAAGLSDSECWEFRCALLHQGRSSQDDLRTRVVITEPGSPWSAHNIRILAANNPEILEFPDQEVAVIDLKEFFLRMSAGALGWLYENREDAVVKRNLNELLRRRPSGIELLVPGPVYTLG